MDSKALNLENRKKMNGICVPEHKMDWEDPRFINVLSGRLPEIRYSSYDSKIENEIKELRCIYDKYDFFQTDTNNFLEDVADKIEKIRLKEPHWYGLDIFELQECIKQQKICLVSGEGGIGKSYFIRNLEDTLDEKLIPHLCIYGKFEKSINRIDFQEILDISRTKTFVFLIDALNEMNHLDQNDLLKKLQDIKFEKGLRVVLTYRTHTLEKDILEKCELLSTAQYEFPGVSFESALDSLLKSSIADIYKYEDILFSNNALILNLLCKVLAYPKIEQESLKSVSSITFILERYIKEKLNSNCWENTKLVAEWMYNNNSKWIDIDSLSNLFDNSSEYIYQMKQQGFISSYTQDGKEEFIFSIDSLTDFLIARYLWDDLDQKDLKTKISTIQSKINEIYGMEEAIILALFDKYSPDYNHIKHILVETALIKYLSYETLVKVNFKTDEIQKFIKLFNPSDVDDLILSFGGYTDKPFNCVNFLNKYYTNADNQLQGLSNTLSSKKYLGKLKGRLKNILYFINENIGKKRRVEEAFYFSFWCCAAPDQDVRCLATKTLYEVIRQNNQYIIELIDLFKKTQDYYMLESVIHVLAYFDNAKNEHIRTFFQFLKNSVTFTLAKSIKRISAYLDESFDYIKWNKTNLFRNTEYAEISEALNDVLHTVDLYDKDLMPFRYWSKDHIDMNVKFLSVDSSEILEWNNMLEMEFKCVRQNGDCNGHLSFNRKVEKLYSVDYSEKNLDDKSFFFSFEQVLKQIFSNYGVQYEEKNLRSFRTGEFENSLFLKCINVAQDIFYGSIMCNYYSSEFATYNNTQDSIGYEVYDPLEYGEDINIASPIPAFHSTIEKLGDKVVDRINIPEKKDERWAKDLSVTQQNLLSLNTPISLKENEWIMIACRVSIYERENDELCWKDTYDYWSCTSPIEKIMGNRNDRYLTIELYDYSGNIDVYENCNEKPWLCKKIKGIKYNSSIFDDASLVLPPAEIIKKLNLFPVYKDMTWIDSEGNVMIYCNNLKNSYYEDFIGSTVFIRKDAYDRFLENGDLKFFAFSERWYTSTGFADETALHFEIEKGQITKKYYNNAKNNSDEEVELYDCSVCPHGFYRKEIT